ncbi:uncharacterized protein LOC110408380 isoform X2 [Numida meleagris]|uniref:uncharacterized protein LOC110408380 isoform X2 n=1 Tax=Numida meleagris TaxID=8996 RepID=UPI000B3D9AD4|nr:uncharacterized protein LOC110408380 isoform X2 [Numida meleagris]
MFIRAGAAQRCVRTDPAPRYPIASCVPLRSGTQPRSTRHRTAPARCCSHPLTPASELWESDHASAQLMCSGGKKERKKKKKKGKEKKDRRRSAAVLGRTEGPARCRGRAGRGCSSGLRHVPALRGDVGWHLPTLCTQLCTSGAARLLLSSLSFRRKKENPSQEEMSGRGCVDLVRADLEGTGAGCSRHQRGRNIMCIENSCAVWEVKLCSHDLRAVEGCGFCPPSPEERLSFPLGVIRSSIGTSAWAVLPRSHCPLLKSALWVRSGSSCSCRHLEGALPIVLRGQGTVGQPGTSCQPCSSPPLSHLLAPKCSDKAVN